MRAVLTSVANDLEDQRQEAIAFGVAANIAVAVMAAGVRPDRDFLMEIADTYLPAEKGKQLRERIAHIVEHTFHVATECSRVRDMGLDGAQKQPEKPQ